MFNIKKPIFINKTIRLPLELVEKLTVLAQAKKISLNNLIVQCCEYALDNIDADESLTQPQGVRGVDHTKHEPDT